MSNQKPTFGRPKAHFESRNQILPNALVFSNLSDTSVRLIAALNALPENWVIYQEDIKKRLSWGRERMDNAVKDCVAKGYMRVTQTKMENGHFGPNHYEFDTKPSFLASSEEKGPDNESQPLLGFPTSEKETSENQHNSSSLELSYLEKDRNEEDPFLPFFPDEKEKLQLLDQYGLDDSAVSFILAYPLDHIRDALEAVEQWAKIRKDKGNAVTDICAAVVKAVKDKWKTYLTPADYQLAKEKELKAFADELTVNKNRIQQMEKSCGEKLPFEYNIKAGEHEVTLRIGKTFCPISYVEDDVINIVQKHINKYCLKD